MYNLIKYSNDDLETSASLWQYCRDKPAVNNNGVIVTFNKASVIDSYSFKEQITGDNSTKDVKIVALLKYLSNFWRALKMSLIWKSLLFWFGL